MISRLLGREDVPAPLAELTAVVVARIGYDGTLVTGNRGLRHVLALAGKAPMPTTLSQAYLSPTADELADLATHHRGGPEDPIFEGRVHVGPADGPVHTLAARVYADEGQLLLIAEHLVEEKDRLADKVLGLNEQLVEVQRAQAGEIRRRKSAEARLEARSQALERSNAELQRFASVVSHDLKEPLRMISSYMQLLQRRVGEELGEEAREFIGYAVDGAERMDGLLDALTQYARIDRSPPEPVPVDLGQVLKDARANLSVAIDQAGVEIVQDPLPTIQGNQRQLLQLFQNLLSNAIKHGPPDGVRIQVRGEAENEHHLVTVTDNGLGIPEEERERIFQIFQQGSGAGEGTGLGLALCQRIVQAHGGSIWVEEAPEHGASFHIRFPQEQQRPAAQEGASGSSTAEV